MKKMTYILSLIFFILTRLIIKSISKIAAFMLNRKKRYTKFIILLPDNTILLTAIYFSILLNP